jgi:carbon-monoxide dehydrogenase catalytic subunit
MGLSCRICNMGPCRVDPFGEGPQVGVCGADADIIVARNLCRMIAAGAASHSDHGRDLVEVLESRGRRQGAGLQNPDEAKLKAVAAEYGVAVEDRKRPGHCRRSGPRHDGRLRHAQKDHPRQPGAGQTAGRVGKAGHHPRGIDRETSEMMHRTHMGVDNNWQSLLLHRACATPCPTGGAAP